MRILILSRYQNKVNRGVETFTLELCNFLKKKNEVVVFSGRDSDSVKKIMSQEWDIVMPLNGRMQSLKVSILRVIKKYKLVIGGHSGVGFDDIFNLMVRPDVFVALTDFQKNWAEKYSKGTFLKKIPNGIDLSKFKPRGKKIQLKLKKPIVLSVGALEWYKHHDKVIRAVERLEDFSLLIVGDGLQRDYLEQLCKKKLKNRYKILKADYKDLPSIYRSCDVFTLPSWDREAFGIVYLEALASNLPVVAPNDLLRKEIIGSAGILTDVDDPEVYARDIKKALNQKWGNKLRIQAEKFAWEKVALEYEKLFNSII